MRLKLKQKKMSPQQEKATVNNKLENEINHNESISNSYLGIPNETSSLKGYWKTHISIPSKFHFFI